MRKEFLKWWDKYIKHEDCPLKSATWSLNEISIIQKAMQDAFYRNKMEKL